MRGRMQSRKMKKLFIALLASTAIISSASAQHSYSYPNQGSPLPPASSYRVKQDVTDGYLNMRTGPGVGFEIMTRIPAGVGDITPIRKDGSVECVMPRDRSSRHPFCQLEWHHFRGWLSSINLEIEE